MKYLGAVFVAGALLGHGLGQSPGQSSSAAPPEVTAAVKQAFRAAYNLDEKEALAEARHAVALWPNEPTTHRALASILWLDILFRRGAVVTDNYLGGGGLKEQVALPKPPADLNDEFKRELAKAIELADARVTQDPRSVQARFDAGTAYAIQASYTATVEGSMLGAMRLAKHAYDYQEFVLAHDPKRVEAGLVIGIYRYLVSTLTLPMRFMAYVAGFGGGKEKGIALIEGASRAFDTHVDAKVSLLLIYNREGRFADAIRVARELEEEFPRNRLLTMEQGSSEIRASRAADAEATLSRGLAAFDKDDRPKIPGERATWLYKRGVARIMLRRTAEARADLEAAEKNQPADWVKGRLQIELGRVADLSGKRTEALAAYRQARDLCIARNDAVCTAQADTLMKQPFR